MIKTCSFWLFFTLTKLMINFTLTIKLNDYFANFYFFSINETIITIIIAIKISKNTQD